MPVGRVAGDEKVVVVGWLGLWFLLAGGLLGMGWDIGRLMKRNETKRNGTKRGGDSNPGVALFQSVLMDGWEGRKEGRKEGRMEDYLMRVG